MFDCNRQIMFLDRNERMNEMKQQYDDLIKQNSELKIAEANIRLQYDQVRMSFRFKTFTNIASPFRLPQKPKSFVLKMNRKEKRFVNTWQY